MFVANTSDKTYETGVTAMVYGDDIGLIYFTCTRTMEAIRKN